MLMRLYFLFLLLLRSTVTQQQSYSCRNDAPCGCSNEQAILAKIVGGQIVIKRSWGWVVSLTQYSDRTHFCAGSIISNSWILTAAHCVYGRHPSDIMIHAGSNHLHYSTQQQNVANISIHPEFDPHTFFNDIALIRLSSALNMNDHDVAKICLPQKTVNIDDNVSINEYPPANSTVVAIGWGQTTPDKMVRSNELQQVTLQTIPYENESCQLLIYSKSRQFCAGVEAGGKDTCDGDSGGPLMKFSSNNQWILAGIISFGYECGHSGYAGIYTRVSFYLDWIETITRRDDSVVFADDNSSDILNDNSRSCSHRSHIVSIVILIWSSLLTIFF